MHDLPPLWGPPVELPPARREPSTQGAARIKSAAAVALHMHQPLIPAGGEELTQARLISNLQYMAEHPEEPDSHNHSVYHRCYRRPGEFIASLVDEGKEPRLMLEYSGTLFEGLRRMGISDVFEELRRITEPGPYRHAVEWLGAAWGHAVAPSTPVQDYRWHVQAWRQHFSALFGAEALSRVRGFSPAEMALPNHPDVAYEFVRTLREAGYDWVLVQEHTVEDPATGRTPQQRHLPHRLVCQNSRGETASITAIIKTQGSDTKLVGHMQPYYEARGLGPAELLGRSVPQLVTQIADGENGGVMMNEFPDKYFEVVRQSSGSDTPLVNVSEYLDLLRELGIQAEQLPPLWPVHQKRIWDRLEPGAGPERLAALLTELAREGGGFHVEGGSWTSDISWVRGYEGLLNEMQRTSALFFERATLVAEPSEARFQNALFHLLCSQTSCYRYW
ncbi:MAG TPA: hypothetical protein VJU61_06380, partial [Polyangiaceae bacterium]|nr:hypothetical protein [Polyangiaceae bacterium]